MSSATKSLYHDEQPLPPVPRALSPPIFPRKQSLGTSKSADITFPVSASSMSGVASLLSTIDVDLKSESSDMEAQHLAIVDGWSTSSPRRPSRGVDIVVISDFPSDILALYTVIGRRN